VSLFHVTREYAIITPAMSHTLTAFATIALYFLSGILISIRLFGDLAKNRLPRMAGILIGLLGVALHGYHLYQGIVSEGGINLSFFGASSLVAWTILLLLMLSALSKPVENLAITMMPIAALAIVLEMHFPTSTLLSATAGWSLKIHVLMSLLAYSLLTMASVQAVLLAVQDYHLRHRHPGGFIRALPPLQTMEALLFEMITLGFALLTVALFSGFLFMDNMFAQHLVHKTLLSIIAWLVFGTLLWGRHKFGWRGQKALVWTIAGFVVLMLAYFGSKLVLELMLTG